MIFGSGTSTTRTSCLPYQQLAFITFLLQKAEDRGSRIVLRAIMRSSIFNPRSSTLSVVTPRRAAGAPGGLPFGRDDFADFHKLLEASQTALDLPFKVFAE